MTLPSGSVADHELSAEVRQSLRDLLELDLMGKGRDEIYARWWCRVEEGPVAGYVGTQWWPPSRMRVLEHSFLGAVIAASAEGEVTVLNPGEFIQLPGTPFVELRRPKRWAAYGFLWRQSAVDSSPATSRSHLRCYVNVDLFGQDRCRLLDDMADHLDDLNVHYLAKTVLGEVRRRDALVVWLPVQPDTRARVDALGDFLDRAAPDMLDGPMPTLAHRGISLAADPADSASLGLLMASVASQATRRAIQNDADLETAWCEVCDDWQLDAARPWEPRSARDPFGFWSAARAE